MNRERLLAIFFAFLALTTLFFKLPEVMSVLGPTMCPTCISALPYAETPYLALIGGGYFAFLLSMLLSSQRFPGKTGTKIGLLFSIGLFVSLTYFSPELCIVCIFAHLCHILLWSCLLWEKHAVDTAQENIYSKLSSAFTAAVSMVALFSTLNITFALYAVSSKQVETTFLKPGTKIATTSFMQPDTISNALVIGFVSQNCPFCHDALKMLNTLSKEISEKNIRVIAVTQTITQEIQEMAPDIEWKEDPSGQLQQQCGVAGYPSLIVLDHHGTVTESVAGIPNKYDERLLLHLNQMVQKVAE